MKKILISIIFLGILIVSIGVIKMSLKRENEIQKVSGKIIEKENCDSLVMLNNIINIDQHPKYPTGCESVALYILLKYYEVDITLEEIVDMLPKGPIPYEKNGIKYGANPEREFVGDPTNINSYGVYNKPIAKVANKIKKGAIAEKGVSLEKIKSLINSGNPVIVWVNVKGKIENLKFSEPWYDYETGEKIIWTKGEHAVVVYGYDDDNFYISNPYNGLKHAQSIKDFEYYYNAMGKRIVYYND